ncbi:MAG: hypothetical protein JO245_00370 [Pseudolabrys sp.]|nr:hypothetical protein [Pseudolabrys sp.]
MLARTSAKLILAAGAFAIAFAAVEASAKPVVFPKGPVKVAPKGPIVAKPLLPKKPPIIVTPKFPKKPPVIIVTPKYPKPVLVVERPLVRPVGFVDRAVVGTCNCLTKDYTPEGLVVFQDLCTKEVAKAPVAGIELKTGDVPASTNFAGKTYEDYLAATQAHAAAAN